MTSAAVVSSCTVTSLGEPVSQKSASKYSNVSYSAAFPPQSETEFEFNSTFHSGFEARDNMCHDVYKSSLPVSAKQNVQNSYNTQPVSPALSSRRASISQSECEEASQQLLGSSSMMYEDDDIQVHTSGSESHRQKNRTRRFRLTHTQTRFLQSEFARQAHPDAAHRERLSREIPGLSARQVQVWFQNRRAKMKRMSTEDCASMLSSRALPDNFDMTPALRETYEQESVNVRARTLSQSSAGPSTWEQQRAGSKRSSIHQEQNSSSTPVALHGAPNYSSIAQTSPVIQRRSSLASPEAPYQIGARNGSGWSDSVISFSQPSTNSYRQYVMLQDGSTFSSYGPGLVENSAMSSHAGTGASFVRQSTSTASSGRLCGFATSHDGLSGQMNPYEHKELMDSSNYKSGGKGQRSSYDVNSQMHPLVGSTTDADAASILAGAGGSGSMSGTSFGLGLGLCSNDRGNGSMRRAIVPMSNPAGSGSKAAGWVGVTEPQRLPAQAGNYTMVGSSTASMSSTAARPTLPTSRTSSQSPS